MRRHPILGYSKMHTGVDWAAPRGTPIIAAGSGVVEKAGWAGGYGRQTIVRHANGYKSSYNHQSALAKGIVPGARVRQGQVIGYVGASGLATGDHLHYELIVNGTKVDPMRVRLPVGRVLKGQDLEAFKRERKRIDELLHEENDGPPLKVASVDK
jgi:murein DD-endopeptidase MepM/ murein hydrolase activator NlpD